MEESDNDTAVERTRRQKEEDEEDDDEQDKNGQNSSDAKRRFMPTHYRSFKRRRFLMVPETEEELDNLEDAYQPEFNDNDNAPVDLDDESVWESLIPVPNYNSYRRPFPSTQALKSMMGSKTKESSTMDSDYNSPLINNFYKSLGMENPYNQAKEDEVQYPTGEGETESMLEDIDNPALSTMKFGHHNRYLWYMRNNNTKSLNPIRRLVQKQELNKLVKLVKKEKFLYRSALIKFHEKYKDRYLIGFDKNNKADKVTSAFSRWACQYAEAINKEWKRVRQETSKVPQRFGPTRQVISLRTTSSTNPGNKHRHILDVEELTCQVVHTQETSSTSSDSINVSFTFASDSKRRLVSTRIPPPDMEKAPSIQLLREDSVALELAARYDADIVTTDETLETLLKLPGDYGSQWMLIASQVSVTSEKADSNNMKTVKILDYPVALPFQSPRACLEAGFQEGLYQYLQQEPEPLQSKKSVEVSDVATMTSSLPLTRYYYSLWIVPKLNHLSSGIASTRKPVRLLIRSIVRLFDSKNKHPLRVRAHAEYFASASSTSADGQDDDDNQHDSISKPRGPEIPNSFETNLWILDQILFDHKTSSQLYRIDPSTCSIISQETTSIAHALLVADNINSSTMNCDGIYQHIHDPLEHWQALIQLLYAIPTIDIPECLLCLPGRINDTNVNASTAETDKAGEETNNANSTSTTTPSMGFKLDPYSVSVHGPWDEKQSTTSAATPAAWIDLGPLLDQGGSVLLNDMAIQDCRRDWEWNKPNQIPYTFPIQDASDSKQRRASSNNETS